MPTLADGELNHCTFPFTHRPHSKLSTKLELNEQEEQDEAMEDIGEEDVIEESAPKKQRLDAEAAGTEELQQDNQVQLKEEKPLEQEMDDGDEEEEEEVEDGDEEDEDEENEELTKDRCGRPRLFALTHSSHGVMYQPPSSLK